MIRKIAAVVLGLMVAFGIVAAVESLGHAVYPMPPDVDISDPVQLGNYVESLPIGAFLFVAGAWILATLGGGLLACFIAREKPLVYSAMVGGFVFLGTVANLITIPHPLWFSISSLIAIAVMTYMTGTIASSFTLADASE